MQLCKLQVNNSHSKHDLLFYVFSICIGKNRGFDLESYEITNYKDGQKENYYLKFHS